MGLYTTYTSENYRILSHTTQPDKPTGQTFTDGTKYYAVMQSLSEERSQYYGMDETTADACEAAVVAMSTGTIKYVATKNRIDNSHVFNIDIVKTTMTFSVEEILIP